MAQHLCTGSSPSDRDRVFRCHPTVRAADRSARQHRHRVDPASRNFVDEAWLFFRANEGTPGRVTNGELTHLTGDLYLLKATAGTVHIERKGA